MEKVTKEKIAAAPAGTPATSSNDGRIFCPSSPSSSLTYKAVIFDVASWWCYAILKQGDLRLFDDLNDVLDSLPRPLPASSSLSIRLRCLVPWQELLKQLYTPGCTVGKKRFEVIQDKLLLLRKGFFSETRAGDEFNGVLRMVQTHSVLSKLFEYFSNSDDDPEDEEEATSKMLDQSNAEWESIYLESDGVPSSLISLVDNQNGWDVEDRKDYIIQIVSSKNSSLTYKRLKKKLQSLLLRWFEHEIGHKDEAGGRVPELLKKRYRGIGYGDEENATHDVSGPAKAVHKGVDVSKEKNFVGFREDSEIFLRPPFGRKRRQQKSWAGVRPTPQQQSHQRGQQQRQQRPSNNIRKRRSREQQYQQEKLVLEFSDDSDWSDDDSEEERKRLKLDHKQQKKFRLNQRISTGRQQLEGQLTMPVGEPSYPEASRRNTTSRCLIRRRHDDRVWTANSRMRPKEIPAFSGSKAYKWTQEQDEALKKGIKFNGYGNWMEILKEEDRFLGSRSRDELRDRANVLLTRR